MNNPRTSRERTAPDERAGSPPLLSIESDTAASPSERHAFVTDSTAPLPDRAPLRLGVLGAGGIATIPEGVLPNVHHIADKVTIVSIADPVTGRAAAAAERFGIPESYLSLDELLEHSDIDAVVNLTPIPAHAETTMRIIEA